MNDTFNIVDGGQQRDVFYPNGANSFYTWNKPSNCQFIHFFVLGGGGGGGGGEGNSAGTARRGGGSGGSSGGVNALFPASSLPERLYIQVGQGGTSGLGAPTNTDGGAGGLSYVMLLPDTGETAQNIVLQSGDVAGLGGVRGASTGGAGAAGTIWSYTNNIFKEFGLVYPFAGQAGVAGLTTPTPNNISISGITGGGAGGAGMNGATAQVGGRVIGGGFIPSISGGTAGGSAGSSTAAGGGSSYMSFIPNEVGYSSQQLMFTGGSGGGSSDGGRGGDGGAGGYGCGGGGGGAGFTNLGGNGGRGGDGIVIITCW